MVWHIFKKDWKLSWMFVAVVSVIQWMSAAILYKAGLFNEDPMLGMLAERVPILAFLASLFLIGAIVHLDTIPGVRQDWLVRPISRRDLLLEKFLFVVLMVNGPIFIAVLLQGLANGFSFWPSLTAAAWQVGFLFFAVTLPIFSFASVTRNMTEAFVFGCGCTFLIIVFQAIASRLNERAHGTLESVAWSGIGWLGETLRFVLVIAAAVTILGLQYFRRRTLFSRFMVLAFGFAILITQFLPWGPAFALERRLSPSPNAGKAVEVAFDAGKGKFRQPSGLAGSSDNAQRSGGGDHTSVFLPLQVSGVQSDAVLITDLVDMHLIGRNGKSAFHVRGDGLQIAKEGPKPAEEPIYQQIEIPASMYREIRGQPIQLELTYSMTLFGLSKSYGIHALDGDQRMPTFGWCRTRMNEGETAVELRCMQPSNGPTCATLFLENEATGQRNPERFRCFSEYTPYSGWYIGDNMARFGGNIAFRDATGLAKFPVDGPQLPQSRIIIRVYEPEDHFTRSLVIPQIKLQDWEAQ